MRPVYILGLILFVVSFAAPLKASTNKVWINQPQLGECLKGGSVYAVNWSNEIDVSTATLIFQTPSQPDQTIVTAANAMVGGTHQTDWSVPILSDPGSIQISGYDVFGNRISQASSSQFFVDATPPEASLLSLKSKSAKSVELTFTSAVERSCQDLGGYRLYRNDQEIAQLLPSDTHYVDTGLTSQTVYHYHLVAFDSFFESTSNILEVQTEAIVPVQPTATPQSISPSPGPQSTATPTPQTSLTASNNQPVDRSVQSSPVATANPIALPSATPAPLPVSTPIPLFVRLDSIRIADRIYKDRQLDQIIEVRHDSKLELFGMASSNMRLELNVYSAKKTFVVTTNDYGYWQAVIDTKNLENGNHRLTISYADQSGKLASERDILHFTVFQALSATSLLAPSAPLLKDISLTPFFLLAALIIIGASGISILYAAKKKITKEQDAAS